MDVLEKIKCGKYWKIEATGSSDVWKHFKKVGITNTRELVPYVICDRCDKIFKFYKGNSTSNLKKHICYKREWQGEPSTSNLKKEIGNKREYQDEQSYVPMTKKSCVSAIGQIQEVVLQNCVNYVIQDLRSIDAINGNAFVELARSLIETGVKLGTKNYSINDILPQFSTVSQRLQELHASNREKFVENLRPYLEEGNCAGTMSIWTDNEKQRNFLIFTVHYLDTTWELHTYAKNLDRFQSSYANIDFFFSQTLFTVELESYDDNGNDIEKSASNIIETIDDKFEEICLESYLHKNMTFTTVEGSNIKMALSNHSRINCAVDMLNNILMHAFDREVLQENAPRVLNLLTKCKSLVEYIKRTGWSCMLETVVNQECCSWWNTKFEMLYSVHQNFITIENVLKKSDETHRLIGIEKQFLNRVIVFLQPFRSATILLENEKDPTIHLVLLQMHIIKEKLLKFRNQEIDSELKFIVSHCLDKHFDSKLQLNKIHKIAAFLWPEYKQLRYLTEIERKEVYSYVKEEIMNITRSANSAESSTNPLSESEETNFSSGDDILAKYKDVYSANDNRSESIINAQIEMYKDACYPEINVLHWWKIHGKEFPLLSKLAQKILCIPASSTASKMFFSSANRIIENGRTNGNGKTLDAILFLHSHQMQAN